MARKYPALTVSAKAEKMLKGGHPWVYGEEVTGQKTPDGVPPLRDGDIVDAVSQKGKYLGSGFVNSTSKIRIRVISKNTNDKFDEAFFERRLRHAVDYRKTVMGADFHACRLIFGEADYFPGLTVDLFDGVLVTQVLCLGIDRIKTMLYTKLIAILAEYGVEVTSLYEKSDSPIRALEGLPSFSGYVDLPGLSHREEPLWIKENDLWFRVEYETGQKTGFFLDQKYNRLAIRNIARGRRVLDCFTHTGAFALNAALGGALSVLAVDISGDALAVARENAERNGLSSVVSFEEADVFDFLSVRANRKGEFDFIILDPPAFTKSRSTVKDAVRGYKEINLKAMKMLAKGGYLATCSCSHFMTDTLFCQMLHQAAEDAGVSLRQIEERRQSPDHPVLWNVPETEYLKFYIFQIV
ncbi:MAG: class I SAM-dependent rRNA methyltransferase [Clostridia bacterium]|nr:class I SAM-dependent rRNA methyltransferase [Clostridia bacterium]